ncbi:hypothetical protein LTR08_000940 [Meristemomyces frigidus]|nr:hypothetical protein LTR08_000940 [Meristemomyces frigidus]
MAPKRKKAYKPPAQHEKEEPPAQREEDGEAAADQIDESAVDESGVPVTDWRRMYADMLATRANTGPHRPASDTDETPLPSQQPGGISKSDTEETPLPPQQPPFFSIKTRQRFTKDEDDALLEGMRTFKRNWVAILARHGPSGSVSNVLGNCNVDQLRLRADYLVRRHENEGVNLPPGLEATPAQARAQAHDFTKDEDDALLEGMRMFEKNWVAILARHGHIGSFSNVLGNRDWHQLRGRATYLIKQHKNGGVDLPPGLDAPATTYAPRFTKDEDEALMEGLRHLNTNFEGILARHGSGGSLSEALASRTFAQIKRRTRTWVASFDAKSENAPWKVIHGEAPAKKKQRMLDGQVGQAAKEGVDRVRFVVNDTSRLPTLDQRVSAVPGNDASSDAPACVDCDRLRSSGWHDDDGHVCEYCHTRRQIPNAESRRRNGGLWASFRQAAWPTHTELRELAYHHARILNPVDPFLAAERIDTTGTDYWQLNRTALKTEAIVRGMRDAASQASTAELITLCQYDDASNGILPRARHEGASALLGKSRRHLLAQSGREGFTTTSPAKAIEHLLKKTEPSSLVQTVDPDWLTALQFTVDDFAQSVTGSVIDASLHTTHNQGIVGDRHTLARLQQSLLDDFFPTETSAVNFLCGPNALANALHATRRLHHETPGVAVPRLTSDNMLNLLFANTDNMATPNGRGEPTPEYQQYLHDREPNLDWEVRLTEYENMTRVNNLDIQQLVAILRLAHQQGLTEQDFSLGLVTSAYTNDKGRKIPAQATVVYQGAATAPTVWLQLNLAAGAGRYNHFEGFEHTSEELDSEVALEWGFLTRGSSKVAKLHLDYRTHYETEIEKLQRDYEHFGARVYRAKRDWIKACEPCKDRGRYSDCERLPGKRHCGQCDEAGLNCEWEEGTSLPNLMLFGDVTMEDIHAYDRPLSVDGMERLRLQTINQHAPADVEERHIALIGCGRCSSHPGALPLRQVLHNTIMTTHLVSNQLNDPARANTLEFGGLMGLPAQLFFAVFARWGGKPVPTHLGNLNDPTLIAFVNHFDHLTRPGNPQLPDQFIFVLMRLAGFSVDVSGWGDRNHGFFKHMLDRGAAQGTNFAYRIYLMPVVERHVVDQTSPSSINFGLPPHGIRHNNKFYMKYRLADVVDRNVQLKGAATAAGMSFLDYMSDVTRVHAGLPPLHAGFVVPAWPANPWNLAPPGMASYLDRFITGSFWERAWRVSGLDATTSPTETAVRYNNVGRNAAGQP